MSRWSGYEKLTLEITCSNPACGKAAVLTGVARTNALRPGHRAYCSCACSDACRAANISAGRSTPEAWERASVAHKAVASTPAERARLKALRVVRWADPAAHTRQSETMKRIGNRPPPPGVGINGVPTPCEAPLLTALPAEAGWVLHHRVPGMRGSPVDLALPAPPALLSRLMGSPIGMPPRRSAIAPRRTP